MEFLRIGEASRASGLSIPQLRYLQRIGLVAPASSGSHRRYGTEHMAQLRLIRSLLDLGHSPNRILAVVAANAAMGGARAPAGESIYEALLRTARKPKGISISVATPKDYNTAYQQLRRAARRNGVTNLRLTKRGSVLEAKVGPATSRDTRRTRASSKVSRGLGSKSR